MALADLKARFLTAPGRFLASGDASLSTLKARFPVRTLKTFEAAIDQGSMRRLLKRTETVTRRVTLGGVTADPRTLPTIFGITPETVLTPRRQVFTVGDRSTTVPLTSRTDELRSRLVVQPGVTVRFSKENPEIAAIREHLAAPVIPTSTTKETGMPHIFGIPDFVTDPLVDLGTRLIGGVAQGPQLGDVVPGLDLTSSAGCLPGFVRNPLTGKCELALGNRVGPDVMPDQQNGARAHMGDHAPFITEVRTRRCFPGFVLGKDGICHDDIPNKKREWPRPTRPLGTSGEMAAVTKAGRFATRLLTKEKQLKKIATALGKASCK